MRSLDERGISPLKFDEIKQLIELIGDTDINELSVETEKGVKVSIKKGSDHFVERVVHAPPEPTPATLAVPNVASQQATPDVTDESDDLIRVPAPMVGTFYRAPDPEADPYVKEGDVIHVGQPLCIIEAMKLMNEIESEVKGRIVRILVEDGEPVQYGEPLFLIATE